MTCQLKMFFCLQKNSISLTDLITQNIQFSFKSRKNNNKRKERLWKDTACHWSICMGISAPQYKIHNISSIHPSILPSIRPLILKPWTWCPSWSLKLHRAIHAQHIHQLARCPIETYVAKKGRKSLAHSFCSQFIKHIHSMNWEQNLCADMFSP